MSNILPFSYQYQIIQDAQAPIEALLYDDFEDIHATTENTATDAANNIKQDMTQIDLEKIGDKAKDTFTDIKNTAEDTRLPQVRAAVLANCELSLAMLVPFFVALFGAFVTYYYTTNGGEGAKFSNDGRISTLIPLFMILGPEIVHKALAITTASPRNDSPFLSCGWLSYSLSTLLTALSGTPGMLPKPELDSKVMNLTSGHCRTNTSFLLSRLLRDLELEYAPATGGLVIEILDAGPPITPLSWFRTVSTNGVTMAVSFAQLAIATAIYILTSELSVLLIFATSVLLMESLANLPAWAAQKFSTARKDEGKNAAYALMRGNGCRHVFIIRNTHPAAWNLEDLAASSSAVTSYDYCRTFEQTVLIFSFCVFAALALLSLQLSDCSAVSLLLLMLFGTAGNAVTAACSRAPWAHGIALESVDVIHDNCNVVYALHSLERKYPGFGEPLLQEFFPGVMREGEKKWWDEIKEFRETEKMKKKIADE
ncbi:hypothetical protein EJ02DRAFT_457933 [Clathrospora elynae]|uniref:Uncharacterized protein n=1 Tax=Clathrospora elynae TaxID=706981 RepID=A0A6A5SG35_9PLEO|nr:hypothetical protein EJ02DRAFT_457933 [Clathrospora elynae]